MTEKNTDIAAVQFGTFSTGLQSSRDINVITYGRVVEKLPEVIIKNWRTKPESSSNNLETLAVKSAGYSEPEYKRFRNRKLT